MKLWARVRCLVFSDSQCIYILALELASPWNRHCASCMGALLFPIIVLLHYVDSTVQLRSDSDGLSLCSYIDRRRVAVYWAMDRRTPIYWHRWAVCRHHPSPKLLVIIHCLPQQPTIRRSSTGPRHSFTMLLMLHASRQRPPTCSAVFTRHETCVRHDTILYDTRCYINVRSKANMSQLNLPHGADN